MAESKLRRLHRGYLTGEVSENRLFRAITRAGLHPVWEYEPCTKCPSETRTVKSHGVAVLCDSCGGDGWTTATITSWTTPPQL